MIEEATGTRMYEQKRESSAKLAEKKQLKWNEITSILENELQPKINKLKEDREAYLEFQRLGREIEQNEKIVIAFKYTKGNYDVIDAFITHKNLNDVILVNDKLSGADKKEAELKEREVELVDEKAQAEKEIDEINQLVNQMTEQNEAEKGEKMAELEGRLSQKQKEFAKKQAAMKAEQDKLKQHQKQCENTKKQLKKIEQQIDHKTKQRTELGESHESNQQAAEEADEEFQKARVYIHLVFWGFIFM